MNVKNQPLLCSLRWVTRIFLITKNIPVGLAVVLVVLVVLVVVVVVVLVVLVVVVVCSRTVIFVVKTVWFMVVRSSRSMDI